MVGWPKFIPQHGLDALKTYKYSAEDHSILTKLFLKRFWDWVVTLFPLWVAYVVPALPIVGFPPLPSVYPSDCRYPIQGSSLRVHFLWRTTLWLRIKTKIGPKKY